MLEAYRVLKPFDWRGWRFAPKNSCKCVCGDCNHKVGSGCECGCGCTCQIMPAFYGGDVWIVEDGHARKEMMLENRFAKYDDSLPPVDALLKQKKYKKLLLKPDDPDNVDNEHKLPPKSAKSQTQTKEVMV